MPLPFQINIDKHILENDKDFDNDYIYKYHI